MNGKFENFERGEPVWALLEGSKAVVISPFFAHNVVEQVRKEMGFRQTNPLAVEAPWTWQKLMPVAACAGLALMAGFSAQQSDERTAGIELIDPALEFEVVTNLESYLADRDNATWLTESN